MPANLTAQYHKAEQEYRRATTPDEELRCLQAMLRELPKHKGTDKLQAELKQKISRAKKETELAASAKKPHGLRIPRQGAGRAVLVGAPNVGKSQLVRSLTRAEPEVAPYPFTTREPAPAMMPWEDVFVQLIDTPPTTQDFLDANVRGLIRGADLVLLVADLSHDDGMTECDHVLQHLNQTKTRLASESRLDESDVGVSFTRTFLACNKIDAADASLRLELIVEDMQLEFDRFVVSAAQGTGLDELRAAVYNAMDVVRIYTKAPQHKEPDFTKPFTVRRGGTLGEVAQLVHKDFAKNLKFARVWGSQVHPATVVKADYVLHDKDVVELHA